MKLHENNKKEALSGNLWKAIIFITLPVFLYQFINSIYSLVDQMMVSSISASSVSAVASIAQIKNLISSLALGLSSGGAILVSRASGASELIKANKIANTVFTLSLFLIGFIIILIPFSDTILLISKVPDDLKVLSSLYFKLQLIEQILIVFNSIFIALQRAKCSTFILLIGNISLMVIKLIFNYLFIYVIKTENLAFIELSSIIAQMCMSVIGVYNLFFKKDDIRLSFKELSLDKDTIKKILVCSFPLFLGKFIVFFGKVTVNAMCAFYGSLTIGALSVSNSLTGLITNPVTSFEDSESALVSLNIGNKNLSRTIKIFLITCLYAISFSIIGFVLIRFVFLDQIVYMFSLAKGNDSIEFTNIIKDIFYYDCITIPALAIAYSLTGFLYGYGKTFLSTLVNIFRIVIRISSLYILQNFTNLGVKSVGISMALSNITIALMSLIFFIIYLISIKHKGYKGLMLNKPSN